MEQRRGVFFAVAGVLLGRHQTLQFKRAEEKLDAGPVTSALPNGSALLLSTWRAKE